MPLPDTIKQIFKRKQKSYKMVLILSLIEELRGSHREHVSFDRIKERFLNYFVTEQDRGNRVDHPPGRESWAEVTPSQLKDIISSPVNALSSIIFFNTQDNSMGFQSTIISQLGEEGLVELKELAQQELENYNTALKEFSIKQYLDEIMDRYVLAKKIAQPAIL